jgi:hypothetical protein
MSKTKLDALPSSDDEYWKDAEVIKIKLEDTPSCDHYFKRVSGTQAECRKCRIGYFLTPEFEIKKGHIYTGEELVI